MPRLVSFYVQCAVVGFALAAVFVGALAWGDIAGLGHLIAGTAEGPLALFLLWFFNGIVFTGAQASVRVLLMAEDAGGDGPRGGLRSDLVAIPVRVPAGRARRTPLSRR
ncbi:hypothetical protein [Roseivivax isoporae]|uniref:Uncharacterized protein n=1 Tax=Roseivivax isoporae LMG 25204 TaxID=1449351 RepID=X7F908_9RHOB|nr:hypothetical protein [Roseivivax isoporae]ETX28539.1 hypothetical protein RISW2_06525 [Roseivivax isoporae LMG 25204]